MTKLQLRLKPKASKAVTMFACKKEKTRGQAQQTCVILYSEKSEKPIDSN